MPCPLDRARGGPRTPTGTVTAVPCDIQTARVDAPSLPMHTLSIGVSCGSSGAWCPGSQPFCFVSKGMRQAGRPVFVGSWLVWGSRTWTRQPACRPAVPSADAPSGLWAFGPVFPGPAFLHGWPLLVLQDCSDATSSRSIASFLRVASLTCPYPCAALGTLWGVSRVICCPFPWRTQCPTEGESLHAFLFSSESRG